MPDDDDLPDPLTLEDGTPVNSAEVWVEQRRPELLALFATQVYGLTPAAEVDVEWEQLDNTAGALDGAADRIQVRGHIGGRGGPTMDVLVYLPAGATEPVPTFVGMNFSGNHTVHRDPGIVVSPNWEPEQVRQGESVDAEAVRGERTGRFPIETILDRGYGLATVWYGDLDPDFDDGFANGIHPLFYEDGQTEPGPDEWGSIGAWAWGISRTIDWAETDDRIDDERIAAYGHSRLGKTALWAAAQDERIALVAANNSGSSGAALSRRRFGETLAVMNGLFPHWTSKNYHCFNDREDELPVDQHQLLALVAPRPLYVASAEDDLWSDPLGQFLATQAASPVYELLGVDGLPAEEHPPVGQPAMGTLGYHIRAGEHDLTAYDWDQYLTFAELHLN